MPEGPELYKAAQLLNRIGSQYKFGSVVKASNAKAANSEITWDKRPFCISAVSRGKEIRITLTEDDHKEPASLNILLKFGMTGRFAFTEASQLFKHSMLMFYTVDKQHAFSFVDSRHFGRWEMSNDWGPPSKRGPCIISEYLLFRAHVLASVHKAVFDKPICELMLDQRYFSSIGNYLRAEILYRLDIDPFTPARTVLLPVTESDSLEPAKLNNKLEVQAGNENQIKFDNQNGVEIAIKSEKEDVIKCENQTVKYELESDETECKTKPVQKEPSKTECKTESKTECKTEPDFLRMCHKVCWEVINLSGSGAPYDPEGLFGDHAVFEEWLQCYMQDGMGNSVDNKSRTIWHSKKFRGKGNSRHDTRTTKKNKEESPETTVKRIPRNSRKRTDNTEDEQVKRVKVEKVKVEKIKVEKVKVEKNKVEKVKVEKVETKSKYFSRVTRSNINLKKS